MATTTNTQVFPGSTNNSSTTTTFVVPTSTTSIQALLVGGGGGGGRSLAAAPTTTLRGTTDLSASATSIILQVGAQTWPTSGSVQIDSEIIPYTGLTIGTNQATLTGCTRGTGAAIHLAGSTVTLLNATTGVGGGGGGGGEVKVVTIPVSSTDTVKPGDTLTITCGNGGVAGGGTNIGTGSATTIALGTTVLYTANPGFGAGTNLTTGATAGNSNAGGTNTGVITQNPSTCTIRGGGGGGNGGIGNIPSTTNIKTGGVGGAGTSTLMNNGTTYTFGGGGGGGTSYASNVQGVGGPGGTGGGGSGGVDSDGIAGSQSTGGGGGGVGRDPANTVAVNGGRGGSGTVILVYDTVNLTYSVTPSTGVTVDQNGNYSAAEGNTVTFSVTTTGLNNNTALFWGIKTVSSTTQTADFNSSSGSFTVTGDTNGATGTFSVNIVADTNQTEVEYFVVGIGLSALDITNQSFVANSVTINITNPTATYSLVASAPSNNPGGNILTNGLDEGATVTFTFSATNYATGTAFQWFITNSSTLDFPQTSGTVTNNTGDFYSSSGTFIIGPTADFLTEPSAETFNVLVKDPTGTTTLASIGPITINDTTQGSSPNKYWYGARTDGTYARFTGTAGQLTIETNSTNKLSGLISDGQYVTIVGTPGVQSTTSNISTTTNTVTLATAFQSTPPVGSKITFHGTTTGTGGFGTYYSGKTYYVYSSSSPSAFTLTETAPVQGSVWTCTQIVGTISGSGILVANALSGLIVSPNSTAAIVDAASPGQGTIVMPAKKAVDTINPYSNYAYIATYKISGVSISGSNVLCTLNQISGTVLPQTNSGLLNGLTLHFSGNWDSTGTSSRWFSGSGGTGAQTAPPDLSENAIFNSASGEGLVLVGPNSQCSNLLMTGSLFNSASKVELSGTSATGSVLTIAQSAHLTPYGSSRSTGFIPKLKFGTLVSGDLQPNGFVCGDIEIDKHIGTSLATLVLLSDLTVSSNSTLTMTGGIFDANGYNVTVGKYVSSATASAGQGRVLMKAGTWTATYDSATGSDAIWDSTSTAIELQATTSIDNNVKLMYTKGTTALSTNITTTLPTMVVYGSNTTTPYIEVTDPSDLPNNSELLIDNEMFKMTSWTTAYKPARVLVSARAETLSGIQSTVAAHTSKTTAIECSSACGAILTNMTQSSTTTQIFNLIPISTDGAFSCTQANLVVGIPIITGTTSIANITNQPPNSLILVTGGQGTAGNGIESTSTAPYFTTGTTYMVSEILQGSPGAVTQFRMRLVSTGQGGTITTDQIKTNVGGTMGYNVTTNDLRFGVNVGVTFKGASGGVMKIDDETITYLPGSANNGANVFRVTGRGITDPVSNRTSNALPHTLISPITADVAQANSLAIIKDLGNTNWDSVAGTTGAVYAINTVISIKNPTAAINTTGTVWPVNAFQVAYRKFSANATQTFNKLILSSYGTVVHTYMTGGATINSLTNLINPTTIYPAAQELYFISSSSYKFNSFDFTGTSSYIQKIYGYPTVSLKPTITKIQPPGTDNWWDVGMSCTLNSTTSANNSQTIYKTSTATVDHLSFNYIQGSPIDPLRANGYGANLFLTFRD